MDGEIEFQLNCLFGDCADENDFILLLQGMRISSDPHGEVEYLKSCESPIMKRLCRDCTSIDDVNDVVAKYIGVDHTDRVAVLYDLFRCLSGSTVR